MLGPTTAKLIRKSPCDVLTVTKLARDVGSAGPLRFRMIVCAVDFSERSLVAVDHALDLAEEAGGQIVPVHVIGELPSEGERTESMDLRVPEYMRAREIEAQRRLEDALVHIPRARLSPASFLARRSRPR